MSAKYQVPVSKATAIAYLSWEIGLKPTLIKSMIEPIGNSRYIIKLTLFTNNNLSIFKRRRDAESYLRRVREVVKL
jgi:hypothetical protein